MATLRSAGCKAHLPLQAGWGGGSGRVGLGPGAGGSGHPGLVTESGLSAISSSFKKFQILVSKIYHIDFYFNNHLRICFY